MWWPGPWRLVWRPIPPPPCGLATPCSALSAPTPHTPTPPPARKMHEPSTPTGPQAAPLHALGGRATYQAFFFVVEGPWVLRASPPPQSRPPPFLPCTGPPPSYLPRVRAGGTPAPFLTRTRPHNSCVQARPPGGFVAAKQIERTRLTHVPPPPPTNTASKQASNNQPCGEQRTPCKQCKQLRER